MGWGDAWAGLSQQAMGFAIDSLRSKEQQKYQAERDEIARRAAEDQEKARRAWEEKMMDKQAKLSRQQKDAEVAQTFIDPQTGAIVPITRGQISAGRATVPQFELERQRAEAAMAAQGEALKTQKTQADIEAARARAEQARAGAGLSRARMENPERFRSQGGNSQRVAPEVAAARGMYNTLVNKGGDTETAIAQIRDLYGEDVVAQAFPGQAERRNRAAQNVGRVVTGVEDLLNKYLNQ